MKHIWELNDDGSIYIIEVADSTHSGPSCIMCAETFCEFCTRDCWDQECSPETGSLDVGEVVDQLIRYARRTWSVEDEVARYRDEAVKRRKRVEELERQQESDTWRKYHDLMELSKIESRVKNMSDELKALRKKLQDGEFDA